MKPVSMRFSLVLAGILAARPGAAGAPQSISAPHLFTPPACQSAPYPDVPTNHPFCPWIQQIKQDMISNGCGAGFCPDDPVTRQLLATMLERAMRGTSSWEPWRGALRRTLIVNPDVSGPNPPLSSGVRLLDHLAEITDASASNPYLIRLEPGVYDLDGESLELKPFVDIEGSGIGISIVRSDTAGAVVHGADDVELRWLSIENGGGAANSYGVDLGGDAATRLLEIRVTAEGGASNNIAVSSVGDGARLTRVEAVAKATGAAIAIGVQMNGDATLDGVVASVSSAAAARGFHAFSGASTIENSAAFASGATTVYGVGLETGASATLRRVQVSAASIAPGATAVGLRLLDGAATVQSSSFQGVATNAFGLQAAQLAGAHTVRILQSRLIGSDHTVEGDSGYTIRIGDSQLAGGAADDNGAVLTCFGVYDENFANAGGLASCP